MSRAVFLHVYLQGEKAARFLLELCFSGPWVEVFRTYVIFILGILIYLWVHEIFS